MAMTDPRIAALEYLDKHNINQLFEIIGSKLAVLKPEDPNAFIVAELSKIAAAKGRQESVHLFDEKDMATMFSIFDITGRKFLTQPQFVRALSYVGIDKPTEPMPPVKQIDEATFVKAMMTEITKRSV
jgi:hypothetical protein